MHKLFLGKSIIIAGIKNCDEQTVELLKLFAREGANLVINITNDKDIDMKKLIKELEGFEIKVSYIQGEISIDEVARKIVAVTIFEYGKIDIVINVTEMNNERVFEEVNFENLGLKSSSALCKYALPYIKKQKEGKIINVSLF